MDIKLVAADATQACEAFLDQLPAELARPETGAPAFEIVGIVNADEKTLMRY